MTAAMILAAGLGSRLRPLTAELPKPLVPLGDRPVIAHVAERLANAGITRAAINVFFRAEAFTPAVIAELPLALDVIQEAVLLGTAGGVANARASFGAAREVVVWNGDIVADVDVEALVRAHCVNRPIATLAYVPRGIGEGTVGVSADGLVVRLRGERFGTEAHGGDFLGIQSFDASAFKYLPENGCLVGDVYLPALRRGESVRGFAAPGAWDDVGSIASYHVANARWLALSGSDAFVGEGAVVAPAVELRDSIVGAGAVVSGRGALERVVVWPGASVEAPCADAIVTTRGVVPVPR